LRVSSKGAFRCGFKGAAALVVGTGGFGAVATEEEGHDEGGGASQDDHAAPGPVVLHDGGGRGARGARGGGGGHGLVVVVVQVVWVQVYVVGLLASACVGVLGRRGG